MIRKIYIALGRVLFVLSIPMMWLFLSKKPRAYVFIEQDARVLLVKNWLGSGKWSLPGGGVHRGETLLQAVVRETAEEVGVAMDSSKTRYLKEGFSKRFIGGKRYAIFHYVADVTVTLRPNRLELADTVWVPLPSLSSMPGLSYEVIAALDAR